MVWLGIKRIGKKLGFRKTDTEALGFVGNIFAKIADRMGMKTLEIIFPSFDDNDKEFVLKFFAENKIKEYDWKQDGVLIIFRENFLPYSVKKIHNIIISISNYFGNKYPLEHKCQNCGQLNEGDIYFIKDDSKYLCNSCLDDITNKLHEEKIKDDQLPSNYLMGFLGSIIFPIPGILLTIILFVFLNKIAAMSALLYITLAKLGYTKFKGKLTQFGSIIISCSGILMTAIGIVVSYIVCIVFQIKTFDGIFDILKIPEVQNELAFNIKFALFLSLIVIIINLFQMKKEWSFPKIKRAKEI
jgi:hypothetical protein